MNPAFLKAAYLATPFLAIAVAEAVHTPDFPELTGYGALGIICAWLIYRDERRAAKQDKQMDDLKGLSRTIAHKFTGLNRALTLQAATHGNETIKVIAQKELQRIDEAEREANSDRPY